MFLPAIKVRKYPKLPVNVGAGLHAAQKKHAIAEEPPKLHKIALKKKAATAAAPVQSVAIIGAGIAGLFTGYLLDLCGISYEIFEGEKRVGGRVLTYHFPNDPDGEQYGDLGAMRIPPTHLHVLELIDLLGLNSKKIKYVLSNDNALFYVNQQPIITVEEAGADAKQNLLGFLYLHLQALPGDPPPTDIPPNTPHVVLQLKNSLSTAKLHCANCEHPVPDPQNFSSIPHLYSALNAELQHDFVCHMQTNFDKFVEKYDSYSVREYLAMQMGIWFDTHFTNDQTDKQKVLASLLDYVEVCITATGENQLSLVDVCADSWDFEGNADNWITLNGGLAQIADTLAKRLTGPIHTNARVVKIDSTDAGVQLTYTSNVTGCQKTTKYFTSVICATPSHNLRFIEMNPPFSYEKFHAIRSLNYDRSTKVFLQFPKRFWDPMAPPQIKHETGGQHTAIAKKAPGASIGQGGTTSTDLPVFKVVYPSYGTNPDLCVLLASYTWTNDSDLIANMDHIERVALCLHNLRRLHGQDVVPDAVDYKVQLWQQAYALFYAGQFTHTFGPMVQSEHEVYFAGEHLSTRHAWIEGAIDSAAEAVLLLLREHELPIPPEVERWAEDSPWFEPESQPKPDTTSG